MSITAQDESQTRPADQAGRGARVLVADLGADLLLCAAVVAGAGGHLLDLPDLLPYIRNLGGKDVEPAFRHGTAVLDLEKKLHIDVEMSLNRLGEHFTIVRDVASVHYHTLHWWMTIGTAAWLFITNKAGYRRGSFVLILTTLMALAGFCLDADGPTAHVRRLRRHARGDVVVGLVESVGIAGTGLAEQPVCGDAVAALRLGHLVRPDDRAVREADLGAGARRAVPGVDDPRGDDHGQPLHSRRRRHHGGHRGRRRHRVFAVECDCRGGVRAA